MIIVAIVTGVLGLMDGSKPAPTTAFNRNSNIVGNNISAGGNVNVSVNNGATPEKMNSIDQRLAELKELALQQNADKAKSNPAFLKIVQNIYKKPYAQLITQESVTLWDNVLKALERAEKAEKNVAALKQGTLGEELKALIPKIEQAREAFDYDAVNRLLKEFREHHTDLRQDLAKADYLQGQNYELQINYLEAERYYKKAAVSEDQDPLYLNAHAEILWTLGRYSEAEPLYRRALAIDEKVLGREHPHVATSLNNLAFLLNKQGKYREAEPLYRQALAMDEKVYGREHPEVATDLNNLAELLREQGKYTAAEPLYRRALAIREKKLGREHPEVAQSLNNLALLLDMQCKYTEAEPLLREAVAIDEKALGKEHPTTVKLRKNLNILLAEKKQGCGWWAGLWNGLKWW